MSSAMGTTDLDLMRSQLALSPTDLGYHGGANVDYHVVKSEEVGLLPASYGFAQPIPPPQEPLQVQTAAEQQYERLVEDLYLPEAHQMYHYGQRSVQFSTQVPMNNHNQGVTILQQFVGYPPVVGHEVVSDDSAIQNRDWNHIGHMLKPADRAGGSLPLAGTLGNSSFARVDYSEAVDIKGLHLHSNRDAPPHSRRSPNFSKMLKLRTSDKERLTQTGNMVAHVLSTEVMGERGVREFFSRPEAVSYERTRSVA
eukprot:CAMPEP_0197624848 /NCGR_PEP_ID=MMETSP1338-20131121/4368_1 /TAXON_ID=43686 ORGANISM="Pelagodinium beii, Strain RCC1491" /NCGR_SAMPLE_ID=MMETSP1338 /ASSEMBLY_ACC=CAM_ASM_000754 /LENGTH=253 /DNA_ID=CAMNT_0043195087 /DNA_START=52 /DNA_END=813 /DNA_ORIENTATION=+